MSKNETKRLRVTNFYAQINQMDYQNEGEIWLVQEEGDENWKLLTNANGGNFGLTAPYGLMGSLCSTRALDVEDGELLVNGQRIKAEQYLPLWREATRIKARDFGLAGHQLMVTIPRPAQAMRAELSRDSSSPEQMKRHQLLLQHPGLSESDKVMAWDLDLLTEVGMQAYAALYWVFLSADAFNGFDREAKFRLITVKPLPRETEAISSELPHYPENVNQHQLSFCL